PMPSTSIKSRSITPTMPHRSARSSSSLGAIHALPIPMVAEPPGGKPFPPFLLEDLLHQAVILRRIARQEIQRKAAELEGEGALANLPQLIVKVALRAHDGNLVNRRIFEPDLAVDGANGRLRGFRVGHIDTHGTGFEQHRAQLRELPHVPAKDVGQ